jgi:hypothetical protein
VAGFQPFPPGRFSTFGDITISGSVGGGGVAWPAPVSSRNYETRTLVALLLEQGYEGFIGFDGDP